MTKGDKWGRLTCVEVIAVEEKITAVDHKGHEYETGDVFEFTNYVLKCECGKTIEIAADKFDGKRKVKDCGCGLASDDGVCVMMSLSMPLVMRRRVQAYADDQNMKLSPAIVRVLERGFKVIDEERANTADTAEWAGN